MLSPAKYFKDPPLQSGLSNTLYHSPQRPNSQPVKLTAGNTPMRSVLSQSRPHARSPRPREVKMTVLSVLLISNLFEVLGSIISTVLAFEVLAGTTGDGLVVTLDVKIHVPAFATPMLLTMWQQLF